MGAAPLLLALAVVTADAGWENDGRGGYRYIVQVPMEQWETIRREGSITSQIPPELQGKVSSIVIRIGDGPIPKATIDASRISSSYPAPPDEVTTLRAQDGGAQFQMPTRESLAEQGRQLLQDVSSAATEKANEMRRQSGDQLSDVVNNVIDDARSAASSQFTNQPTQQPNPAAPRGVTTPPPLQPPTIPAGGPSTGPTTSANAYGNSDFGGFGAAGNTPRTSPNPAANPAVTDPPSMQPTTQSTTQFSQQNERIPQVIEVRLERMAEAFQFRDDVLQVDERVLFVLGLEKELRLNEDGELVDKFTGNAVRETDVRYEAVVNFRDTYSDFVQRQKAEQYRQQQNNQFTNRNASAPLASLPTNGFGPVGSAYNQSYDLGNPLPSSQTSAAERALDEREKRLKLQQDMLDLKLAMAQNTGTQQPPAGTTTGFPNQAGPNQTGQNVAGNGADNGTSTKPSDEEQESSGKKSKQSDSPPLFNFLLLFSVIANLYMGMQISRLLQRYRNLVASQRGNSLAT